MKNTFLTVLCALQSALCISQNADIQSFVTADQTSKSKIASQIAGVNVTPQKNLSDNDEIGKETEKKKIENLGREVNSVYSEVRPTVSADGSILYFVVEDHPKNTFFKKFKRSQDIWFSEKSTDGKWTSAKQAPSVLNSQKTNSVFWVSPDGTRLLLRGAFTDGKYSGRGFSMVQKNDTSWGLPEKLNIINYEKLSMDAYSGATMVNNGKTLLLYFSEEKNSFSNDIYISNLMENGDWSEPVKIGEPISTELYDEITPFLASDGLTLYFSSDRKGGLGAHDIWMSRRLDETWRNWSDPVNVSSVNTKGWDAYFTMDAAGEKGLIATSENSIGGTDLASVILAPGEKPEMGVVVYGKVLDSKSLEPFSAPIVHEIFSDSKKMDFDIAFSSDGSYKIILPAGKRYILKLSSDEFPALYDTIDLGGPGVSREIRRDIHVQSAKHAEPAINTGNSAAAEKAITELNTLPEPSKVLASEVGNILFDFNKAILRIDSYDDLDKAFEILNAYPAMRVELSAHTDNIGKFSYNLLLSVKRANSAKKYLVSKGIESERIVPKGYGEKHPVSDNSTREGRKLNRRVEFKVIQ